MKLTAAAREVLTTMAQHPPERPFVLYRTGRGPYLPRFGNGQAWLAVPESQVDRLVTAGLLVEQGPHWKITPKGRAMIAEPVPARSRRRRAERPA